MKSGDGIDEWRSVLPSHVVQKSEELLARVEEMRINQVIYPPQDDVLNALASCAPSEVRAVILGQDPYHGPGQAMGLSFSVPAGEKLPPSLRNIYKEMAADLGCGMPKSETLRAVGEPGRAAAEYYTHRSRAWAGQPCEARLASAYEPCGEGML